MYHTYTIGNNTNSMVYVWYIYSTGPKDIYHTAKPLYIGISAG